MADKPVRALLRFQLGTPFRLASAEEKQQTIDVFGQMLKKWKSSGVKLIGGFDSYGDGTTGYAHLAILEVDDVAVIESLNNDIFASDMLFEKHSIEIGDLRPMFEKFWE